MNQMRIIIKAGLYVLIFLFLASISSYITFRVMGAKKTVAVPDLRGKSLIEANKEIITKRLYLKIEGEEFSADIPEGSIIRQEVPPEEGIKEGRSIRVVVSKGPKRYNMPVFIGLSIDEARDLALKSNIRISQIIKVPSEGFDEGIVIAQRPTPEERGDDKISLLVSSGRFQNLYSCPDFTGMTLSEAKELADGMGLELELIGYGSRILEQQPKTKEPVKRGDIIKLKLEYREDQQLRWL